MSSPDIESSFPSHLAEKIHTLVLDVDGVLTDGGLYYSLQNQVMKQFHVHDGLGIKMALSCGINIAVITGIISPAVEKRVRELGIKDYFAGFTDKRDCLKEIKLKYNLTWEQMAYLGDDWIDLSVMHMVGLPLAVANAQPEVKSIARFITNANGGQGAVREIIRYILIAQGKYNALLSSWSQHTCQEK